MDLARLIFINFVKFRKKTKKIAGLTLIYKSFRITSQFSNHTGAEIRLKGKHGVIPSRSRRCKRIVFLKYVTREIGEGLKR
ncbi:hypothetical protein HMPREF9353_02207 [Treponema denticola F0402]|nr:hypothetical protein HMPREF9353_02207 [Treponema denticola F0402]